VSELRARVMREFAADWAIRAAVSGVAASTTSAPDELA
jgi:hypothetical protein